MNLILANLTKWVKNRRKAQKSVFFVEGLSKKLVQKYKRKVFLLLYFNNNIIIIVSSELMLI